MITRDQLDALLSDVQSIQDRADKYAERLEAENKWTASLPFEHLSIATRSFIANIVHGSAAKELPLKSEGG